MEKGVGWTPQANKDEVILNVCQLYQRMSLKIIHQFYILYIVVSLDL